MSWPEGLTAAQQAMIQNYVDQAYRPAVLKLAQAFAKANLLVIPQYLVSPTGLASTFVSPAADSVAGLLAGLPGADIIPILNTGLALAGPVSVASVIANTVSLNSLLATNFTLAAQEAYAQIIGSPNLFS